MLMLTHQGLNVFLSNRTLCHYVMFCLSDISGISNLMVKNMPAMREDLGSTPRLGRSPGEGNGYLFQYSGLENSMDRGSWQATVHGVTKSQTRLCLSLSLCLILIQLLLISLFNVKRYRRPCKQFDPWVGKIPQRRKWQPLQYSAVNTEKSHGQRRLTMSCNE